MSEIKLKAKHKESGEWKTFNLQSIIDGHLPSERYMLGNWTITEAPELTQTKLDTARKVAVKNHREILIASNKIYNALFNLTPTKFAKQFRDQIKELEEANKLLQDLVKPISDQELLELIEEGE